MGLTRKGRRSAPDFAGQIRQFTGTDGVFVTGKPLETMEFADQCGGVAALPNNSNHSYHRSLNTLPP
jgi:hypothetical protein